MDRYIGRKVLKDFGAEHGKFSGIVTNCRKVGRAEAEDAYPGQKVTHFLQVTYEDGDVEEYSECELKTYLTEMEDLRGKKRRVSEFVDVDTSKAVTASRASSQPAPSVACEEEDLEAENIPAPENAGGRRKRVKAEIRSGTVFAQPTTFPPPQNPGRIDKIRVENFMCHANLEMSFGSHINFVVGENGSGKSAILAALCICFGTKAKGTNRATTLKNFIKAGAHSALVAVTLNNAGSDAFKYEQYGNSITVERRILPSGAPFTLKNQKGEKVCAGRAELDNILDHFSIDVSNPCTVMTQDSSRSFLHSGKDEDKYKFFMQGTLLQSVQDRLMGVERNLATWAELVAKHEEDLPREQEKLRRLKDALQEAQAVEVLKMEELHLQRKLIWSCVHDIKRDKDAIHSRLATEECPEDAPEHLKQSWGDGPKKLAAASQKLDAAAAAAAAAEQKRTEIFHEVEQLGSELARLVEQKQRVESEHKESKRVVARLSNSIRGQENKVRELSQQRAAVQESVNEIKSVAAQQAATQQESQSAQQVLLLAAQNRQEEAKEAVAEAHSQYRDLLQTEQEYGRRVEEAKQEHDASRHQVQRAEGLLRTLRNTMQSRECAFGGAPVPKLQALIKQNAHRFHSPPIGPVGSFVTLKDPRWAQAVDVCIGGLLNNFIVNDFEDREVLRGLCRQAQMPDPGIVYRHSTPKYEQLAVPEAGFTTVLAMVDCSSDLVFNILVDQGKIESTILVESYQEGTQIAFQQRPRNVSSCILLDGMKMSKSGNTEIMQPRTNTRPPRLGVDQTQQVSEQEAVLRALEEQLAEASKRVRAAENEHHGARERTRQAASLKTQAQSSLAEAEAQGLDLQREAAERHANDDTSMTDAEVLEDELRSMDAEIQTVQQRIAGDQQELALAEQRNAEVELRVQEQLELVRAMTERNDEASKGMQEASAASSHSKQALRDAEKYRDKIVAKVQELEKMYADKATEYETAVAAAQQRCTEAQLEEAGGADPRPDAGALLHKDLSILRRRIAQQEARMSEGDSVEELQESVARQSEYVEEFEHRLEDERAPLQMMQDSTAKRAQLLKTCAKNIKIAVSNNFNRYMNKRGHVGRIKVVHNIGHEKLEMVVIMNSLSGSGGEKVSNTKTLSGGERSYSTLAFTLALNSQSEAPFRAMDEFDVFMDAVNRKVGVEQLVAFAKENNTKQFIYLTPQDVTMLGKELGSEFLRVMRMPNAAR